MIDPITALRTAIIPALGLLPPNMRTRAARAQTLAIALQESGLRHRKQVLGPAHGLWQFEPIGCEGVLTHHASRANAQRVCRELLISPEANAVYEAIVYHDVLAAAFARLAMWRYPGPLPMRHSADDAWAQYIETWRPGKPHRERWDENYALAWATVAVESGES